MTKAPRDDPWSTLGLKEGAGEKELRCAYLRQIKAHPPDQDPDVFEEIRDAYNALRDPLRRFELMVESLDPDAPLDSLLDGDGSCERGFVGPGAWLRALKEG